MNTGTQAAARRATWWTSQQSDEAPGGGRGRQAAPDDRGCLTTFSIANDVAKYFAILPAMFVAVYPQIAPLDVMHLASPRSASSRPSSSTR